ncbi:MAG: excinuclease ABC subunit A, partial [Azorhizobium sp. 32-67-21]
VLALPEGARLYLLAPVIRGRKGEYRKEMADFLKKGFQRVKVDGTFHEIAEAPPLDKKLKHDIDVVVDRVVVRPDLATRLADSFETALGLADGIAVIEFADEKDEAGAPRRILFSEKFACPVSGFTIPEIEPRLFSFNNPFGACPACDGLGVEQTIDPDLVVPDRSRTLKQGAIAPWAKSTSPYYGQTLNALAKHYGFKLTTPFADLPEKAREVILYGSGEEQITFAYDDGLRAYETTKTFEGIVRNLDRRWRETDSDWAREEISKYFSTVPCAVCHGFRLKPEALAVKVATRHIGEVSELSVRDAAEWFETLPAALSAKQNEIAARILKEIRDRLRFLMDVGLDYLTLARASGTLS